MSEVNEVRPLWVDPRSHVSPDVAASDDHIVNENRYKCHGQFDCYFCGMESLMQRGRSEVTGRLLTLIDGAIANQDQNKALKDMISQIVNDLFFSPYDGPNRASLMRATCSILANAIENEYQSTLPRPTSLEGSLAKK